MYRWTDPIDPDDASRRPEPPTDQGPAWLVDGPEPRSSYFFGDRAAQPGHGPVAQPGYGPAAWGPGHPAPGPVAAGPDHGLGYDHRAPFEPAGGPGRHLAGQHGHEVGAYPADRDRWNGDEQPAGAWAQPTAAWQPVTDTPPEDRRHGRRRRFSRPLVIGGTAAAATLVVSLGVGALLLPGGDGTPERTAADAPVVVAPDGPAPTGSEPPVDALVPASVSPSAAPTTAKPSPTKKVAPRPSRTEAPSRQLERSSAPSGTGARTTSAGRLSAELQQVVDLVNQERAKAGCRALAVSSKLTLAAQRHSQDQADHKKMSHDGSDGSNVGQRLDRAGYAWRAYGENVAWNQQSPAAVMDAWMHSEGHRANILNCSFTQIGVGVARSNGPYWTQDFGTPR
ncbi:CAP domain-containing protein [Micromonospora sp. NPDC050980]|uniref:CAP domain-containing protein n=1 Tax=Micromonospora sp. NPDC050980 TaxID=3155161 RepID=UPI0033C65541